MLRTRLLTALVLLGVLLPALFRAPQWLWAALGTLMVVAAAWEWTGLLRASKIQRVLFPMAFLSVCVAILWVDPSSAWLLQKPDDPYVRLHGGIWNGPLYGISILFWLGVVPFWLRSKWVLSARNGWFLNGLGWGVGFVLLLPPWLALLHLRAVDAPLLLAVLAVAWVADVAAYFAGRRWGKHKLAPTISPGKTWEGAAGALAGILILGAVLAFMTPYALPVFPMVLGLCLLTVVSILGDLFESMIKRQAGLKDSSQLLPGHGGVLDRVDSLTSTLPLAAMLLLWIFP